MNKSLFENFYLDHKVEELSEIILVDDKINDLSTSSRAFSLSEYEKEDNTMSSQTFACSGDVCEVVDIT